MIKIALDQSAVDFIDIYNPAGITGSATPLLLELLGSKAVFLAPLVQFI